MDVGQASGYGGVESPFDFDLFGGGDAPIFKSLGDGVMHFARLVLPLGVEREQLHVRWRWRVHGHEDVAQGLRQGSQDAMVAGDELEVERLLQAELVGPLARVGLVGQDFGGETEFGPNRVGPPLSRTVSNTAPDRSAASNMILPSRSCDQKGAGSKKPYAVS